MGEGTAAVAGLVEVALGCLPYMHARLYWSCAGRGSCAWRAVLGTFVLGIVSESCLMNAEVFVLEAFAYLPVALRVGMTLDPWLPILCAVHVKENFFMKAPSTAFSIEATLTGYTNFHGRRCFVYSS